MLTLNAFLFLITLCVAKSEMDYETMCKNDFRDEKNNSIDVLQYCSDKICIEKCCDPDKFLVAGSRCINMKKFHNRTKNQYTYIESQYNSTNILSNFNVTETAKKKVVFVQNQRNSIYLNNCTAARVATEIYVISKDDGSLQVQQTSGAISTVERLQYCIDKNVERIKGNPLVLTLKVSTIVRQIIEDPNKGKSISYFENIVVMISSFFLLLVLIVYCLLPDLRNLPGLILMAYTWTLLVAFITKLILFFIMMQPKPPDNICKIMAPFVYFGFVSSIFWLSAYAFDVWWGLRSFRVKRNSKHGKLIKFMWYALYAWGTPLLLTTIIAVLDNLSDLKLAVPTPFTTCLANGKPLDFYYKIPVGILIFINIVLFCMTVYNIWMVKRAVNKCQECTKSKQQSNKFATYAKLFLMMGVSWCLDLFPPEEKLWTYILVNLYNLLTGVNIFYMFVCKRIILLQLCKKFNNRNDYIRNLELKLNQNHTQSRITKSTDRSSTIRTSQDQAQNTDQNCPKEETTVV